MILVVNLVHKLCLTFKRVTRIKPLVQFTGFVKYCPTKKKKNHTLKLHDLLHIVHSSQLGHIVHFQNTPHCHLLFSTFKKIICTFPLQVAPIWRVTDNLSTCISTGWRAVTGLTSYARS